MRSAIRVTFKGKSTHALTKSPAVFRRENRNTFHLVPRSNGKILFLIRVSVSSSAAQTNEKDSVIVMSSPIEIDNNVTKLNTEVTDNDTHSQFQQLCTKVKELEKEKIKIHDEYDAQRAQFKKLYYQKEEELNNVKSKQLDLEKEVERLTKELDEAKSQLCIAGIVKENEVEAEKQRAQEEIATLNQIVNESVEVSTTSQSEVKKLKQVIRKLEHQLNKLKGEKEREGNLLAPSNVISGAKSLARKVVGQLGNDSDLRSHDNLEDSMKKAQEDTELIRSLVIPLEETIRELKEKLTLAEEKIRRYESGDACGNASPRQNEKSLIDLSCGTSQESGGAASPKGDSRSPLKEGVDLFPSEGGIQGHGAAVSPSKSISCDMCANYEAQLVVQQRMTRQLEKQKETVEANMERIKEDLNKETQFRMSMEEKWNEKKEEHKAQVSELRTLYENAEKEQRKLQKYFEQFQKEVQNDLLTLSFDRAKINEELVSLQRENDNLMGKYSVHSEQLRNECINFPDTVGELQECLLKSHEELIAAKVAKEATEEQLNTMRCENQLLRDQMNNENEMQNNLLIMRNELEAKERELSKYMEANAESEERIRTLLKQSEFQRKENKEQEETILELRNRVGSLQKKLDTSEAVQMDFVTLSQSLQVELESIRGADSEVRWQHDEDVTECRGCKNKFASGKNKIHCRHCGKIFCSSCLTCRVLSGPNKRPSQVCQVCHTLLNRETAPYFSQKPPQLPD